MITASLRNDATPRLKGAEECTQKVCQEAKVTQTTRLPYLSDPNQSQLQGSTSARRAVVNGDQEYAWKRSSDAFGMHYNRDALAPANLAAERSKLRKEQAKEVNDTLRWTHRAISNNDALVQILMEREQANKDANVNRKVVGDVKPLAPRVRIAEERLRDAESHEDPPHHLARGSTFLADGGSKDQALAQMHQFRSARALKEEQVSHSPSHTSVRAPIVSC